jgi:hypothetical protein
MFSGTLDGRKQGQSAIQDFVKGKGLAKNILHMSK